MTAEQIMRNSVMWKTWSSTAIDGHCAIWFVTDPRDWRESRVLYEDTLRAQDIMGEVTK